MKTLLVFLLTLAVASSAEQHKHWGYKNSDTTYGTEEWSHHNPECGKTRQSPVQLKCSGHTNAGPVELFMNGKSTEAKATNNGHSVTFAISTSDKRPLRMKGGPLQSEFVVEQFHLHWGSKKSASVGLGSEHRVAGVPTAAELHVVTFNSKYKTFKEAVDKADGLAVFGVLFSSRASRNNSPLFTAGVDLQKLVNNGASVTIPASGELAEGLMKALKRTKVLEKYFTYSGSLTTPPCFQTVQWIVSRRVGGLPTGMLEALQKFTDGNGSPIVDNFRPLQQLNGRKILCK